jgi:hypothetical protein
MPTTIPRHALLALQALIVLAPAAALANEKTLVRGFPPEMRQEIAAGKLFGKPIGPVNVCYAPGVCIAKGDTLPSITTGVIGSPRFHPGQVTLGNGARLTGRVLVQGETRDWDFVKRRVYLIPQGEADAYFLPLDTVVELRQRTTDAELVFDAYDGVLLQRLLSGAVRLSYNPAANTSRKLGEFVSPAVLEDAQRRVVGQTVLDTLKAGGDLREARGKAEAKQVAMEALASIEITDKEYLVYETGPRKLHAVTKRNYGEVMRALFAACPALDGAAAQSLGRSMSDIKKAVTALNQACPGAPGS